MSGRGLRGLFLALGEMYVMCRSGKAHRACLQPCCERAHVHLACGSRCYHLPPFENCV